MTRGISGTLAQCQAVWDGSGEMATNRQATPQMGTVSTGLGLLTAYVCLVVGVSLNYGFYSPTGLLLVIVSFGLVASCFVWVLRDQAFDRRAPQTPAFAVALIVLLCAGLPGSPGLYLTSSVYRSLYHWWLVILGIAVALVYLVPRPELRRIRRPVVLAAVIVAFAFRIWMPIASPAPKIDVFSNSQESAQHLLQGKNPYTTPVSAVYQQQTGQRVYTDGYAYLPGTLYLQSASYWLTGDVRYAYVLAELIVAFSLWRLVRVRWDPSIGELTVLLFLYNPKALFVLEQSWVDPLILMFFALFLVLRAYRRPLLASASFGAMVVLKEYMVVAFFQWLIIERDWKRILTALVVGTAILVPFTGPLVRYFTARGGFYSGSGGSPDSLTIFSWVYRTFGLMPPPASALVAGLVLAAVTIVAQWGRPSLRGFTIGLTMTFLGMFLAGTSSVCNWYYLVAGFLIFALGLGGKRPEMGLESTSESQLAGRGSL